jgi:hypothetical protein
VQLVEVENTGDLAKALLELLDVGDVWADVYGRLEERRPQGSFKDLCENHVQYVVGLERVHFGAEEKCG